MHKIILSIIKSTIFKNQLCAFDCLLWDETTVYLTSKETKEPLVVFYTNDEGCWQTYASIKEVIIETNEYDCIRENEIVKNTYEALSNGEIKKL